MKESFILEEYTNAYFISAVSAYAIYYKFRQLSCETCLFLFFEFVLVLHAMSLIKACRIVRTVLISSAVKTQSPLEGASPLFKKNIWASMF